MENKTKKELLEQVEREELEWLNAISIEELREHVAEWLQLTEEEYETLKEQSKGEMIERYMNNFMEWKGEYSEEELMVLLGN